MRLVRTVSAIAGAAALATACTDSTVLAPRTPKPPLTASVSALGPRSHPNSQKYRDAGFQPAIGRSGSAVVSGRALVDKSGVTDVEVTTGTFDGPSSGTLASAQVKAFTPSGDVAFTNNYNRLGTATADFSYRTLPHGANVQVQAVVQGVDGSRSSIVTLATSVHMRPDLVASQLYGAAASPVGAAVNFDGYVLERNGEVGARADCVLYANGAEIDRANGIWVDAAGLVACSMTHLFTEAGGYALELRVENVHPGDFATSNNVARAEIVIYTPPPPPSGFRTFGFQAWDITDVSWWHSVSTLEQWDGTVETWDQIYTRSGREQSASINGLIPRALDYHAPITLRGEMSTNGATVNTVEDTYESLPWVDWQQGYCDYRYNFETRGVTYICVYTDGYLAGYTYVQYDWSGADIHYTSNSYVYYWDPSGALHEAWYSSDYSDIAPLVTMGPDFSGRLSVQAAADEEPMVAQATVPFVPTNLFFDYVDPLCGTTPAPPGCFELHGHTFGQMGYTNYGDWPPYQP